jgi:glycosyltransferase involved in cell wall biosynthesis
MSKPPIMLTISAAEWDGIQHRPHHFMRRSARTGWRVIYVEPPATLLAPLKNKNMLDRWKKWLQGLRQAEEGIFLLAPPPTLPFGNQYRWINKCNQWLISRSVKKALHKLGVTQCNPATQATSSPAEIGSEPAAQVDVFTFLHNAVDLLPYLPPHHGQVIYDCVDDHAAFTGLIDAKVVLQMEKELMKRADVCFATARQLMEDRKDWSDNFHLIPNGAEYERFEPASQVGSLPTPQDISDITQPIIGFYGGISDWIDIPLLTEVAREMPHVTFVMIGPVHTAVEEMKKLSNVKFLGTKPYDQLPQYIQHFSTCLVPFRINKLTESVNPVKLFEYLSAGKPVVSTPLPEVVTYQEVVELGRTKEEMIAAIEKTISPEEHQPERVAKRQEVGRTNSWDARWDTAVSLIHADQEKAKAKGKEHYVTSQ